MALPDNAFITLHYRLGGEHGDLVNTFDGTPATFSLGSGALSPELEECLQTMSEGERKTFTLAEGQAFGPRRPDLIQWVTDQLLFELSTSTDEFNVGDVVQFPTPDGSGNYAGTALEIEENRVLFDFNHPLAGREVEFEAHLIGVMED